VAEGMQRLADHSGGGGKPWREARPDVFAEVPHPLDGREGARGGSTVEDERGRAVTDDGRCAVPYDLTCRDLRMQAGRVASAGAASPAAAICGSPQPRTRPPAPLQGSHGAVKVENGIVTGLVSPCSRSRRLQSSPVR